MRNSVNLTIKPSLILILAVLFSSVLFADSTYVVKKGDTLYSISRKYELTVAELLAANNLGENDILREGVKLVIPSADISNAAALSGAVKSSAGASGRDFSAARTKTVAYTVQKGDTLYGIARKNGMKLPELLALNNIDTSATIKVGQKILVPSVSEENSAVIQKPSDFSDGKLQISSTVSVKGVVWPLENPSVKNISGKVSGVHLTGKNNESVKAVREGTVMYTGVYRGFGEVVFVQSKTGLIYSYSGLEKVTAKKGDYVISGEELGRVGKGSEASIKFMVFQNGMPVDPAKAPRG